ncbi:GntR family transcriptional regulator [Palleronia sediminis]|uniref:GntR family transcriptional regulator n=1 Tax=Palleronia sediminis TaxID=2547833 RepID=A0A4V3BA08_9RHOB|nr:GntR family transcriptional regulator [Palleronia sediminis]TDL81159.1 GntR family transcriptional regulator [Palleronia sediminis]
MTISGKLAPISTSFTLKDHTYGVLRAAILDMNIYDDATDLRLDERSIAMQLGISRTPIREALVRLAQEGLVEIVPRKGAFVKRKSLDEILEMIVTWAALECMAARLAAERATPADLRALRKSAMAHSDEARRGDYEAYGRANIAFHQHILDLSGCSLLRTTADGLFAHMLAVRRRALTEADRAIRSVGDHLEIIDALESRDPDLSARLVREHTMKLHSHIAETWPRLEQAPQEREGSG